MDEQVKIVECPRDAWQGLSRQIPTEGKAAYLRALVAAGFSHIDAVSFVSPAAVPQMADSEAVLYELDPPDDVEIIGIVVNVKGAERAIKTGAVQTLGFPYSISARFLKRNQNQTQEESLQVLETISTQSNAAGLDMVAYVSMAFGNPYGEAWSAKDVVDACRRLFALGIRQISLADTVGLATPAQIAEIVAQVKATHQKCEIGVHLHARPKEAGKKIHAAYDAGCRRFDSAIGGLGGCPFAQDDLVGNIPTETLLAELNALGATVPKLGYMEKLIQTNAEISRTFAAASN